MRSGSRSTRISRATPPTRVTRPTPGTADSSRVTVRSTNHESSVSVMLSDATLHVTIAPPAVVTRETIGSLASARQIGADARHRVAHVVERGREIRAEAELDARRRRAFVDGRGHLLDAGDRRDGVLDLARDLALHLRRRDAGIRDRDDDGRELDVGPIQHAELREADQARDRQRDEQDDDGNRIADRPGDEVHEPPTALLDADAIAVLQEAGALVDDALAGFDAADDLDRARRARRPSRCGGARRRCPR